MSAVDAAEYEAFVGATAHALRRTAYLMCGDWQRAEDATQDALVKLYVAWPRVRRHEGLRTYAHRAVTTAVIDQSRRPWRREVARDSLPDTAQAGADPAVGTERRLAVMAALRELPPRRRACVVLRYFADLSVAETAEVLNIDAGTVKSQTARALDQLRGSLATTGLDLALEDLA